MAVKNQADETVVFSWIVWPSKQAHEKSWEKIMQDERLNPENSEMPFDGKRILFGRFETVLEG